MKKQFEVVLERGFYHVIDPDTQRIVTDPKILDQVAFRQWPGKPFFVQLEVDETSNPSVKSVQKINIHIDTQEEQNGI